METVASIIRKRNIRALLFFAGFYLCFGAYLTINQERFIYLPDDTVFGDCPMLEAAERVTHGTTRMYTKSGYRGVVVIYHGNAGAACDRAFYTDDIVEAGFGYILVEYPGYGGDAMPPSHERTKMAVADAVAYLETITPPRTLLIGESLGGGAAGFHTTLAPPEAVLLITPFASLSDVAERIYWFYPTRWLVDDAFDNIAAFRAFAGSLTIIHGGNDTLIPAESSRLIADARVAGTTEYITIPHAGHNNLFLFPETEEALINFLSR
jgi:pimeloyl-ACP methyl ester carboxylesterase